MYDGEIRIDTRIDTTGLDKGVNEVQGKLNRSVKGLQSLMKGAGLAAAFAALAKGVKQVAESTEALENSIRKALNAFRRCSCERGQPTRKDPAAFILYRYRSRGDRRRAL